MEIMVEGFFSLTGAILREFWCRGYKFSLRNAKADDHEKNAMIGFAFWIGFFLVVRFLVLPAMGYQSDEVP